MNQIMSFLLLLSLIATLTPHPISHNTLDPPLITLSLPTQSFDIYKGEAFSYPLLISSIISQRVYHRLSGVS